MIPIELVLRMLIILATILFFAGMVWFWCSLVNEARRMTAESGAAEPIFVQCENDYLEQGLWGRDQ